jgi:glycosyltransferase involved in cell wall biosynthesis
MIDPPESVGEVPRWTVVSRLIWPGIGRMALEQSRRLPARLVVYRESPQRQVYAVPADAAVFLRRGSETGRWTPLLARATLLFNADRGEDATVDLDLIVHATRRVSGPVLYHDQFAGLTGYLRRLEHGDDYAVYVHETSLGDRRGVMDQTLRASPLSTPLRAYDRTILRKAKVVFTNSVRNRQILEAEGVSPIIAYPGSNPIDRLPTERERFILSVGVWERTKRPEVYAELARATRVPVVLAGMWGRTEEFEAFRRANGDLVRVTGAISEQELDRLSRTASLYVRFGFAERGPGQGGIQALGYGMPVLTNRELAASEIITDGVDGFVVANVEEAARRVAELFEAPQRMRAMSEAAWSKSRTLDWNVHASRIREGLARMA